MNSENEIVYLYLEDIIPNRFQPREVFDERALQELSQSIKEHGVIQPIIVRSIGSKYEIIAGERRYKASALAGLTKIPAIIRNLDDKESSKVALLENLQRRDLNPMEEARTYQKILELDEMTQEDLARTMGKSQPAVANKLRLLLLPEEVQEALLKEQISERHARSLLTLENKEDQIRMMNEVINNRMTVRELDAEIKNLNQKDQPISTSDMPSAPRFVNFDQPQDDASTQGGATNESLPQGDPVADLDALLNLKKPTEIKTLESQLDDVLEHTPVESTPFSPNTNPEPPEVLSPSSNADAIEPLFPEEEASTPPAPSSTYDLKTAINNTRDVIRDIEQNGFLVRVEERDLEDAYQFIIKIEKNK